MFAGTAIVDITPGHPVWMDGMIRAHLSEGVHDHVYARALALSNAEAASAAYVIVAIDVCDLTEEDHASIRAGAAKLGVDEDRLIVAATHTHSGPAVFGHFCPREGEYAGEMVHSVVKAIERAVDGLQPATIGYGLGSETTISHYRRLLTRDGHVLMNWEPWPADQIIGPLGEVDPDVAVLTVLTATDPPRRLCTLFSHAGHPNVLSGDNYLISADYPGRAVELVAEELGGNAIFLNGAQGTMDIDGLRDRDWDGRERIGAALADAVRTVIIGISASAAPGIRGASANYSIPRRVITDSEWSWAEQILARTGGAYEPVADGVGDDYVAALYRSIRENRNESMNVRQTCAAIGDFACLTFPGELYTEIGMRIKASSPFGLTAIIGLANGSVGYLPTRKAIAEGGYAELVRLVDAGAEEIVVEHSLELLNRVFNLPEVCDYEQYSV